MALNRCPLVKALPIPVAVFEVHSGVRSLAVRQPLIARRNRPRSENRTSVDFGAYGRGMGRGSDDERAFPDRTGAKHSVREAAGSEAEVRRIVIEEHAEEADAVVALALSTGRNMGGSESLFSVVRNDEGDWIGLYGQDGRIIAEGHSFETSELLRLVGIPHLNIYDVVIPENKGHLPRTLGEIAALGGITQEVRP